MKGADRPKGHSQGAAGALPSSSSSSSLSLASSGPQIQSQWNGATCCLKAAAQLELAGARGLMLGAHPAPGGREPSLIWDHRMQAATGPLLSSLHSQAPPSCSFCRALGGEEEGDGGELGTLPRSFFSLLELSQQLAPSPVLLSLLQCRLLHNFTRHWLCLGLLSILYLAQQLP